MLTIDIDYDNGFPQYNSNVIHSDAWDYWKIFQKVNDGEIYSSMMILFYTELGNYLDTDFFTEQDRYLEKVLMRIAGSL